MKDRRRRVESAYVVIVAAIVSSSIAVACASATTRLPPPQVPGGDPQRGAQAIERLGCGSCHVIPGISRARGTTGPPLTDFSHRGYIAGQLPNNGPNLIRWIIDPQEVEPGTAMPNLNVSEAEARDIAAYLFTLGR